MQPLDANDPHDLQRFVTAQGPVYDEVRSELREGRKRGHWMWFVFPQLKGLGHSYMSQRFGISGRDEAEAYVRHPILGPRLLECTRMVLDASGRAIEGIFGDIDAVKFRSSMTLFAHVADDEAFRQALDVFFGGDPDPLTLRRL